MGKRSKQSESEESSSEEEGEEATATKGSSDDEGSESSDEEADDKGSTRDQSPSPDKPEDPDDLGAVRTVSDLGVSEPLDNRLASALKKKQLSAHAKWSVSSPLSSASPEDHPHRLHHRCICTHATQLLCSGC